MKIEDGFLLTVHFHGGTVGVGNGNVRTPDGTKKHCVSFRELSKQYPIGDFDQQCAKSEMIDNPPKVMFVFEKPESIDVIVRALWSCKAAIMNDEAERK